ncbi:hypothetical protein FRC01_003686 [Tulasnella sp. 417]|nr:hypothetical protein FRC01_003686 [Tulasnella sp. 417]
MFDVRLRPGDNPWKSYHLDPPPPHCFENRFSISYCSYNIHRQHYRANVNARQAARPAIFTGRNVCQQVTINAMIIAWVSRLPQARCQRGQHTRCGGISEPPSLDFLWGAAYDHSETRPLDPDGPMKPSVDIERPSSSKPEV